MAKQTFHVSARAFRITVAVATAILIFRFATGTVFAVSSWNPTLFVNTESFQQIDSGDGSTNVELQFGTSTQTLTLLTTGRFQFSKSLSVIGGISGSYLTIDGNANITGALLTKGTITSRTTVSGANLTFMGVTSSYVLGKFGVGLAAPELQLEVAGTMSGKRLSLLSDQAVSTGALFVHQKAAATGALIRNSTTSARPVLGLDSWGKTGTAAHLIFGYRGTFDTDLFRAAASVLKTTGSLHVQTNLSGATFIGAGLGSCNGSTQKLLYNYSTKKFECGSDQTGSAAGGWSNTGSLQAAFDTRFVRKRGDTMTGTLIIRPVAGATSSGLTVVGVISGAQLRSQTFTTSGALVYSSGSRLLATAKPGSGQILIGQGTSSPVFKSPGTAMVWYVGGTLATGLKQGAIITMPFGFTATSVSLYAKGAPTGAALIIDINKDNGTLFSTRPQINDGATTGGGSAVFSTTNIGAGSIITIDIDQVGSTFAGSGLTIMLNGTRKY